LLLSLPTKFIYQIENTLELKAVFHSIDNFQSNSENLYKVWSYDINSENFNNQIQIAKKNNY